MRDNAIMIGGNVFAYVLTALQTNEIFQLAELILSVVLTVLLIAFRLWKWFKEAKKDGEITSDEIQEAIDIIEDGKGGKKK